MPRARVAAAGLSILFAALVASGTASGQGVRDATLLTTRLTSDGIDSSQYPDLRFTVAVTDAAGRAPDDLKPANFSAPGAEIVSVTASVDDRLPAAYVIAVDASPSMAKEVAPGVTRLDLARSLARAFVANLSPVDRVRIIELAGPFSEAKDTVVGWVPRGEPAVPQIEEGITSIALQNTFSAGETIAGLSLVAATRPAEFERATILIITDVDSSAKTGGLAPTQIVDQLGAPVFVAAIREPDATADLELKTLFTSAASLTGGAFIGPSGDVASAIKASRRTWEVVVSDGTRPNGEQNDLVVTVKSGERTGQLKHHYRSGTLLDVTPLNINGIAAGDVVTSDTAIEASLVGGERWRESKIELYRDCSPDSCKNASERATNAPLKHKLVVAPLDQGDHTLVFKVSAKDASGNEFFDSMEMEFGREGTSLNLSFVVVVVGLAAVAILLTSLAARRKRSNGYRGA